MLFDNEAQQVMEQKDRAGSAGIMDSRLCQRAHEISWQFEW